MKAEGTTLVKVTKVTDGDTYKAKLPSGKKITVRMEGIDAPEKKQKYWKESTEVLKQLIEGKYINLKVTGIDQYKRILAYTFLTLYQEASFEMVLSGYAWHFEKYNKNENLKKAQMMAKVKKIGLWADPNPVPPWDFRKQKKQNPIKKVLHI